MSDREKSSVEIEREVESGRSELQDTMTELRSRFSPEGVIEYGTNYLRGSGGQRLIGAIRDNPLAAVLALAGIGWLIYTASQPEAKPSTSASRRRSSMAAHFNERGPRGDSFRADVQPGTAREGTSWQSRRPGPDSKEDHLQQALKDTFPASDPPQSAQPGATGWNLTERTAGAGTERGSRSGSV